MKILIIQSPNYDFQQSSLIEGLSELSKKDSSLIFKCTETSNYALTQEDNHIIDSDVISYGKGSDLIVLCSNNEVKEYLLELIDPEHKKIVYLDGEDSPLYRRNPSDFIYYFKREMLLEADHKKNVYPFQFGAEKRYFKQHQEKEFFLTCMFGPHDDTKSWRKDIEFKLLKMNISKDKSTIIGQIYGNNQNIIDTGNRNHQNYFESLSKSEISVDAYGSLGCQSGRFYEILANKCCLLTQKIRIHMPNEFLENYHYLEYNLDNLEERVNYLSDNREEIQRIARNGYEHLIEYHTTEKRAEYFLEFFK